MVLKVLEKTVYNMMTACAKQQPNFHMNVLARLYLLAASPLDMIPDQNANVKSAADADVRRRIHACVRCADFEPAGTSCKHQHAGALASMPASAHLVITGARRAAVAEDFEERSRTGRALRIGTPVPASAGASVLMAVVMASAAFLTFLALPMARQMLIAREASA